ncbi:hypothetical protein LEP1GSC171_0223 [Leptospira santarosai str. HAI1380]|nr:hypothetical protein LEP1GSC169_2276 [Leptospira santarosai str. HAI1349]EMO20506.1 hypothetical protein LEP1GSC168_3845 [Leptospira santarosai str. HAI134]EMP02453.1 hypothetical protein LEP1GSC171_0223 [Leptospira santarosai str. HAI1380]EMP80686.1 hypothetical protein LEP1GSC162_3714 [Leptospira santarosai str. CBC1531]
MRSFSNCKSSSILRQVGLSFFNILEPTFIQALLHIVRLKLSIKVFSADFPEVVK